MSILSCTDQCQESLPGASVMFCIHLCHVNINATVLSFPQLNHLTLIIAAIVIFNKSNHIVRHCACRFHVSCEITCTVKFSFLISISTFIAPLFSIFLSVGSLFALLSSANRAKRNRVFELSFGTRSSTELTIVIQIVIVFVSAILSFLYCVFLAAQN